MRARRRSKSFAVVLALLLWFLAACGQDGESEDQSTAIDDATAAFRVGMFNFDESAVLAELYAGALEFAGVPVRRVAVSGPREIMAPALQQGQVDLLPEYLGTATGYYAAGDPAPGAATVEHLRDLLEPRGLTALAPSPAKNTNAFVVLSDSGLGPSLSDLIPVARDLRLGGLPECRDRPLCLVGLEDTYGLRFGEFVPQPSLAVTAEALRREEIEVGLMFTTDAEVTNEFLVLDDDKGLQPAENVVPIVRLDALERWGTARVGVAVDAVSAELTTEELRVLNRRLRDDDPARVAGQWLRARGIIG